MSSKIARILNFKGAVIYVRNKCLNCTQKPPKRTMFKVLTHNIFEKKIIMRLKDLSILVLLISYSSLYGGNRFWTGNASAKWNEASNWSPAIIPTAADDVFIQITDADVDILGTAQCQSLYIGGSNASLVIKQGGFFYIDGQSGQREGIHLQSSASIFNDGYLSIRNVESSSSLIEAIEIYGSFTNNGTLQIQDYMYTGSAVDPNDLIKIRIGAEFINTGTIDILESNGLGINNQGTFENKATGEIDLDASLDNTGIYNGYQVNATGSHFINHGDIFGANLNTLMFNFDQSIVDNYGLISVTGTGTSTAIVSIRNYETFNNKSNGIIRINNAGSITNGSNDFTNCTFTNDGLLEFRNQISTTSNYSFCTFVNNGNIFARDCLTGVGNSGNMFNYGSIDVRDLGRTGMNNVGSFDNYGSIHIENIDYEYLAAFRNIETFINRETGTIFIKNSIGHGIDNTRVSNSGPAAHFYNYGAIDIEDTENFYGLRSLQDSNWEGEGSLNINSNSLGIVNGAEMQIRGMVSTPRFSNSGELEIGPGTNTLEVSGDFIAGGNSILKIGASGSTIPGLTHDLLHVMGDLYLDGAVELVTGTYSPSAYTSFDVITFDGQVEGFLDTFYMSPSNSNFDMGYAVDNTIQVKYDECGGNEMTNYFNVLSGNWSTASNWSLGHVPRSCEHVVIAGTLNTPRVVNMNTLNARCKSLHLIRAELSIESGKKLVIDPNFDYASQYYGIKAIDLEFSKLQNFGEIVINHIADNEGIEVHWGAELDNQGLITFGRLEGLNAQAILNRGLLKNSSSGEIITSKINLPYFFPAAIRNFGEIQNDGEIETLYNIDNNTDSSIYAGSGLITMDTFINTGFIRPGNSAGIMNFTGDVFLEPESQIEMEMYGNGDPGDVDGFDQINIIGNLFLDGEVDLLLMNGFKPTNNHRFNMINYTSNLSASFNTINKDNFIANWNFTTIVPNEINLVSTRNCAFKNVVWDGLVSDEWTNRNNWDKGFTPLGCHDVTIPNTVNQVKIPNGTNVQIHSLTIENERLTVETGATLLVDGLGNGVDLVRLDNAELFNSGTTIIENNSKSTSFGIRVDAQSTFSNVNTIVIRDLMGSNSLGIVNYGNLTNKGGISINNVPTGTGLTSWGASATVGITGSGKVFISDCNRGIVNFNSSTFDCFGLISLTNSINTHAILNSDATFTVKPSGEVIGVNTSGQGILNYNNALFHVEGVVE